MKLWQGSSNGVIYIAEVDVNTGAPATLVTYEVTAGNIAEL